MNWVTLEVKGVTGVKFINICAHRNIPVKSVEKKAEELYIVTIPAKDYVSKGRHIARKAGCRVHVLKKSGLGITLRKYKKRVFLWSGIPLVLFLILYFNSVVWQIEITGSGAMEQATTRSLLSEVGIRPGSFFSSFDCNELAEELLNKQQDSLCWVGVRRKGTVLEIELATGTFYEGDPEIPLETACNIVADKSGVITKVLTTAGTNMVKVGDVVEKGQVLISGTVILDDEIITGRPEVKTHAIGEVYAIVTYRETVPIEENVVRKIQTGREKKEYVLYLPGFSVPQPFFKGTDFSEYDTVYKDTFLKGPFGMREITYIETSNITEKISQEQAVVYAEEKAVIALNDDISENAVVLDTSVEVTDGYVTATAECVENIGVLRPIGE